MCVRCSAEKEYQTESKRIETLGGVTFGTNVIQRTWSGRQEINKEATRQGGAPTPPGRALHPRGPLVAPLTDFFRLYIPIYPKTFGSVIFGTNVIHTTWSGSQEAAKAATRG